MTALVGPFTSKLAHLAALDRLAVVPGKPDVIARHRLAGGAVFHVVRPVGEEDVQHLGRAEAVEDVDAVAFAPAPAKFGRQRLPRRHAAAQLELGARRRRGAREEGGIEGRHAEERGDAMPLQQRGDRVRRRPVRQQHGGGADRQRERQRVAETISKEQLRDRIDHVALGEPEDRAGIEVVGQPGIGVDMHRRLRRAGRARGVEPEGDVIARGGRRAIGSALGHAVDELLQARDAQAGRRAPRPRR